MSALHVGPNERPLSTAMLQASAISKSFPGVNALTGVDFTLLAGQVHALVGENGAGKSTLIKIMSGAYAPDAGQVRGGGAVLGATPLAAHRAGVATIHQDHNLVPGMTVAENILLGRWPVRGGLIDRREMQRRAAAAVAAVVPHLSLSDLARSLSPAECQLVEIARAISERSRVLIMDEPTTSLSSREIEQLFAVVRDLRAQGMAIVFVSHWLEEVFAVADHVTVLRDGRMVGSRPAADLTPDGVIRLMVGRDVATVVSQGRVPGPVVLRVEGLRTDALLQDISFEVRAGEIVTLSGLVGAGRSELAACIFGIDRPDGGTVCVAGTTLAPGSPRAAIEAGIGLVPEDRRKQALVGNLSVSINATLAVLRRIAPGGVLSASRETAALETAMRSVGTRMASPEVPIATLSGGNQQKVVIGRWLARKPRVLILDEPTKGIDVGAKAEISALILRLAEQGTAILLITSEMPEVVALSDRVLVMRNGRIAGALDRSAITPEAVMELATLG